MKLKSLYLAGLGLMALSFASCDHAVEPEYTPAEPSANPDIYFAYQASNLYEVGDTDTSINISVYRRTKSGAVSFPVTISISPEAELFTYPTTVTFADGEDKADIEVTFVPTELKGNVDYVVSCRVGDGIVTPYLKQDAEFIINYIPWLPVVGKNGEEYCLYTDDIITGIFSVENTTYELELQYNPLREGLYRVVNPYGTAWPYNDDGGYTTIEPVYLYFNAEDPDRVFMCNPKGGATGNNPVYENAYATDLGVCLNPIYGNIWVMSKASYYMANGMKNEEIDGKDVWGKLKNGVITFPAKALIAFMPDYDSEGGWTANTNGKFKIVFPGVEEEADPNDRWETLGNGLYTDIVLANIYDDDDLGKPLTYEVPVEQYVGDPNLYRMVNPYTNNHPFGEELEKDYDILFDATNPECVNVELQSTGWFDDDMGEIKIANRVWYRRLQGDSDAKIIASGYNSVLADNVFSFGKDNVYVNFSKYNPNNIYIAEGESKLVLPAGLASKAYINKVTSYPTNYKTTRQRLRELKEAGRIAAPDANLKVNTTRLELR